MNELKFIFKSIFLCAVANYHQAKKDQDKHIWVGRCTICGSAIRRKRRVRWVRCEEWFLDSTTLIDKK